MAARIPGWLGHWLGVYPTWQSILLQLGAAIFVIASYFLAARKPLRHT